MTLAAGQRGLITSELRVKKDLAELTSQKFTCPHATTHIDFPEGNILDMSVTITLTGGFYAGGSFALSLKVPQNYPFRPPSVYCLTRIWHPNVDVDSGRVSHPLLDRDWKPVLSINTVIFGLQLLFLEPNPDHFANARAARALLADRAAFAADVRNTLRGGVHFGLHFPPVATKAGGAAGKHRKRGRDADVDMVLDDDGGPARRPDSDSENLAPAKKPFLLATHPQAPGPHAFGGPPPTDNVIAYYIKEHFLPSQYSQAS